jgi:WD40 repeat protein
VAFSPDGKTVATGSNDSTARVWSATTGEPLSPPLRHGDSVNAGEFSPDGRTLISASDDGTARLWNAATGEPIRPPLQHQAEVVRSSPGLRGSSNFRRTLRGGFPSNRNLGMREMMRLSFRVLHFGENSLAALDLTIAFSNK